MIDSKIRLGNGYLTVMLDADLVHLPDREWQFILSILEELRRFEKFRDENPVERQA